MARSTASTSTRSTVSTAIRPTASTASMMLLACLTLLMASQLVEAAPECSSANRNTAFNASACISGVVLDWCHLKTCAKNPGESCGGPSFEDGLCGEDMYCGCNVCIGCNKILDCYYDPKCDYRNVIS